jgi:hypothetical protein
MLQVTLEPTTLVVNQPKKMIFRLTNTSGKFCTNIVFKPTFPIQLVSLKGVDCLEVPRLNAGESIIYEFLVRPKCVGEWAITSRNFSYRDGCGQSRRINDLHFLINVKEMVKEVPPPPKSPPPPLPDGLNSAASGKKIFSSKSHLDNFNPIKKILILAANPKTTPHLRLDEEVREIEEGLRRAKYRSQFDIRSKLAVRLRDLRRALLDYEPHIVHFAGHGKEEGLLVEDEMGSSATISSKALSQLFKLFSNQVECVVLSACYSERQTAAINKHIKYVIGMRKEIADKALIEFAVGFYDALAAGRSIEEAFEFGRSAILAEFPDLPDHLIPVLKKRNT